MTEPGRLSPLKPRQALEQPADALRLAQGPVHARGVALDNRLDVFTRRGGRRPSAQVNCRRPAAAADDLGKTFQRQFASSARRITPSKQIRERDFAAGLAALPQRHRAHGASSDAPGPRMADDARRRIPLVDLRRNGAPRQQIHSLCAMIDREANGIPEFGRQLPLVNQSRQTTFQEKARTNLRHRDVLRRRIHVAKIQRAPRQLLTRRRLAAPFSASHKNCPHVRQFLGDNCVRNPLFVV